jgi:hypothetical protein
LGGVAGQGWCRAAAGWRGKLLTSLASPKQRIVEIAALQEPAYGEHLDPFWFVRMRYDATPLPGNSIKQNN